MPRTNEVIERTVTNKVCRELLETVCGAPNPGRPLTESEKEALLGIFAESTIMLETCRDIVSAVAAILETEGRRKGGHGA